MKKRIVIIGLLLLTVLTVSLAITSPLFQNLLYTGRRTGGSDRAIGHYELAGEDLTLKEPLFGGAYDQPRTIRLTGRIEETAGTISLDLTSGKERTTLTSFPGYFQQEVELPAGSSYIELVLTGFTGRLSLESTAVQ